jgi:STE24 endopeptidase
MTGAYPEVKWRLFLADIVLTAVLFVVFQLCFSRQIVVYLAQKGFPFYLSCFVYGTFFMAFVYAASFPLRFIDAYVTEHKFGLSTQRLAAWLADEAKSVLLSYVLWTACMLVFYFFVRNFHETWWLVTAIAWIFFSVILTQLMPVLLIPIFFKYIPIEDVAMKNRILGLAAKCGIKLVDVCQIDLSSKTKKANAALVGLGKTRKVIIADTLMKGFTPEETQTVVAHEFGHFKFQHIWQLLLFSAIVTVGGFYTLSFIAVKVSTILGSGGISDLFILPSLVLLMAAFGVVIMPIQNWFSRRLEREADRYAIRMTGDPATFISTMRKLAEMNQAEPDPPLLRKILIYNHPPISERIRMAEEIRRTRDEGRGTSN